MKFLPLDSHGLTQDVLKLYCSIKHPALEDLFLKLASVDTTALANWLAREGKPTRVILKDPSVYEALIELCRIRQGISYGGKIEMWPINKVLVNKPILYLTIKGFNDLIHDPVAKDLLEPFADIISTITANSTVSGTPDKTVILDDISKLKNAFLSGALVEEPGASVKKESVQKQKLNMFQGLLMKFSEDVAAAADADGFRDLSTAVKAGILAKPSSPFWKEYIQVATMNQGTAIKVAKAVADFIVKHYDARWTNYNHSLVEVTFMNAAGQLSQEQMTALKNKYEDEKDVMGILEEPEKPYPSYNVGEHISLDKHLNPNYLQLLICFFYVLQAKVGMPGGF